MPTSSRPESRALRVLAPTSRSTEGLPAAPTAGTFNFTGGERAPVTIEARNVEVYGAADAEAAEVAAALPERSKPLRTAGARRSGGFESLGRSDPMPLLASIS